MKYALTDTRARNARPTASPYKLSDGGGLYLLVKPTGSKLWRYKYRIAGKENTFSIGAYPEVSLARARVEHDKARALVEGGVHPLHHRRTDRLKAAAEAANTFKAIAEAWIESRKGRWSPYYCRQIQRYMASDIYPKIGSLPIKQVTSPHILKLMKSAEARGAETVAIQMQQWCSAVFRHACANLQADGDPAACLKGAVTRPKIKHSPSLTAKEIPGLLSALREFGGYRTTVLAVELLLLTFVRTVELRKAEWSEIDFEMKVWRIPAARMKMRRDHLVPLSTQVVALLSELSEWTGNRKYLFPNYRTPSSCMSATTVNRVLERMGYGGKFSAHGFRSTASTLLHEEGWSPQAIERQLAHAERNKVKAAYNHAEYLSERTKMMQAWADTVDRLEKGATVYPIKAAA